MTRVVTFPSRDLYGYGNIRDCLLIETRRVYRSRHSIDYHKL